MNSGNWNSCIKPKGVILRMDAANDVVARLRTPSEADIRALVLKHALLLTVQLYHPVQSGEVQRDPARYISQFIANSYVVQRDIVRCGSYLTFAQVNLLQPPSLIAACMEVIELARCVYADRFIIGLIVDEMRTFMPGLDQEVPR